MFPEFREKITELKSTDPQFIRLFDQHNALDQTIKNMEAAITPSTHDEIETRKKEKLALKDQIYAILKKG